MSESTPEENVATLSERLERLRTREEFVETLASDIPDHPPNFQQVKGVNVGEETVANEKRATLELGPNRCAAE